MPAPRAHIYGRDHQDRRSQLAPTVAAGHAYCTEPRCLQAERWIQPGTPWDLAHDRTNGGYLGPAHQSCNRSEGARYRAAKAAAASPTTRPATTPHRNPRWLPPE